MSQSETSNTGSCWAFFFLFLALLLWKYGRSFFLSTFNNKLHFQLENKHPHHNMGMALGMQALIDVMLSANQEVPDFECPLRFELIR